MLRVSSLLFAALLSACSFVFVDKVHSDWQPSQRPNCSTSFVSPILDAVPPTAAVVAVASGELTDDIDAGGKQLEEAVAAFVLLASSPWLISSIYGFLHRSKCKNAKQKHRMFRNSQPTAR